MDSIKTQLQTEMAHLVATWNALNFDRVELSAEMASIRKEIKALQAAITAAA